MPKPWQWLWRWTRGIPMRGPLSRLARAQWFNERYRILTGTKNKPARFRLCTPCGKERRSRLG